MKKREKGFTLVELMIVVAIIGILASLAVPAYQNFIYKARLSELLSYAGNMATQISTYGGERFATTLVNTCASYPAPTAPNTALTNTIAISADCVITITSKSGANAFPTVVTVIMTPTLNPDRSFSWACSSGGSVYAPAGCP